MHAGSKGIALGGSSTAAGSCAALYFAAQPRAGSNLGRGSKRRDCPLVVAGAEARLSGFTAAQGSKGRRCLLGRGAGAKPSCSGSRDGTSLGCTALPHPPCRAPRAARKPPWSGFQGARRPFGRSRCESAVLGSTGSTKAPLVRVHGRNALVPGDATGVGKHPLPSPARISAHGLHSIISGYHGPH